MNNEQERRIVLDALVSYADACTLPALTPTCPFYEVSDGRPTCGEQCRDIAQARGAEPRRVRSKAVGGLVLLGRELPVRSVAGQDDFDATELRLKHEHDEPVQQPTASLLIGLRDTITAGAFEGSTNVGDGLAYWGELDRRAFPVEQVFTNGVADTLANVVALSVVIPILIRLGLTPLSATDAVEGQLINAHREAWTEVLQGAFQTHLTQPPSRSFTFVPSAADIRQGLGQLISVSIDEESFTSELEKEPFVAFVLRPDTIRRIAAWLAHLFETDLEAALSTTAPPHADTFAAFPFRGQDEIAVWLSDRFLLTDLEQWSSTSLTLEWRHLSGHRDGECPPRILSERVLDRSTVGERALATLGERQPRRTPPQPLSPDLFVRPAQQALQEGKWNTAVGIFQGLTRMMPSDPGAWNNLGFCQLATDPAAAIQTLEYASRLRHGSTIINIANRVLALHRLGQDPEALDLATSCLAGAPREGGVAVMWAHPSEPENALVDEVDPVLYLRSLQEHIVALRGTDENSFS